MLRWEEQKCANCKHYNEYCELDGCATSPLESCSDWEPISDLEGK